MTSRTPQITVIIAFYKNFKALNLIFLSLKKQTFNNFEIIVAEDDNNPKTLVFIEKWRQRMPYTLKHIFQKEDLGFRKNMILNKAVKNSSGKILVFIDGDVVLHRHFLEAHNKHTKPKSVSFGRRIYISRKLTEKLYRSQNLFLLNPISLLFSKSTKLQYSFLHNRIFTSYKKKGIWGSNWSIMKEDLVSINGFDEDYIHAGVGEDNDVEWRLEAIGIKTKSIRYEATQYHLFHKKNYSSDDVNIGYTIMKKNKDKNIYICRNGLRKL